MSRVIKTFFVLLISVYSINAQTPGFFSYQAVACDANGNELVDQKISIRASIIKDGPNGIPQYVEVHSTSTLKTDAFGLFTVEIGSGVVQPALFTALSDINWGTGNYWLRIEMDPTGGFSFNLMGANRLMSVPYAFYAAKAKLAEKALYANKADTALYVAGNVVVQNSINSQFSTNSNHSTTSDTALYTIKAGMANMATNATNAVNAQNAVNANHAIKSDTALYAIKAGMANMATNATNAVNAQNAINANHAIKSDTALYAIKAGMANMATTATNATNAVNAQNAIKAIKSDTALYAIKAGMANMATTATNADNATNAQNAVNAQTAVNATNAQNAVNAQTAVNATNAQNAVTAQTAVNATNAQNAVTAQTAVNATNAQNAVNAQTAVNATNAQNAIKAIKADTALYAIKAGMANMATTATNADNATNAQNAVNAQTAVNATNAQNAVNAQMAQTAVNATNAQNAIKAIKSDTALYAFKAGMANMATHATTADNATNATNAQVATQATTAAFATAAGTAMDDNDRSPTNELQELKFDSITKSLSLVPIGTGTGVKLDLTQVIENSITSVNNIINPSFPEGMQGKYVVIPNTFVVPAGKSLYLTSAGPTVTLPVYNSLHPTAPSMPVFPEYTVIQNCKCTAVLVDKVDSIETVIINLDVLPGNSYTIPSGKVLFVKSGVPIDNGRIEVKAPGTTEFVLFELANSPHQSATRVITFPEGTVIRKPSFNPTMILTGFFGKQHN